MRGPWYDILNDVLHVWTETLLRCEEGCEDIDWAATILSVSPILPAYVLISPFYVYP